MGRDAGISPIVLGLMYLVSDVVMALTHEPFFWLLAWCARSVPALGKVRDAFARASGTAGLRDEGVRGPLGLILFSFTVDPVSARGAAAAAGHGFLAGWTFAIAGDMVYFGVLMAATLWLSGLLGDERSTIGVVLLAVWGLSWLIRRRQQSRGGQLPNAGQAGAGGAWQPAPSTAAIPVEDGRQGIRLWPPRTARPPASAIDKRAGRKRRRR
jgi:hypothetical protein